MRILKEVNQEYIHKCKYCKSVYIYTTKDVDFSWDEYLECPVCKNLDTTSVFDKKVKQCQVKKK